MTVLHGTSVFSSNIILLERFFVWEILTQSMVRDINFLYLKKRIFNLPFGAFHPKTGLCVVKFGKCSSLIQLNSTTNEWMKESMK